jgi:hypothetical protein
MSANQLAALDKFRTDHKVVEPKVAPKPKASVKGTNGKVSRNGTNGRFVSNGKAAIAKAKAAPQPKAEKPVRVVTTETPTVEGFALYVSEIGQGGKDGTGSRIKATVQSFRSEAQIAEGKGHAVRFLIYTDTVGEMELCLSMLGIEDGEAAEVA